MIKEAIIFLGPPGGGKGTQARLLSEDFSLPLVGMGDLLRKEISTESLLGKSLSLFVDRGEMPPWSMIRNILEQALEKIKEPTVIFDGVPRNEEQAKDIQDLFDRQGIKVLIAFHLKVPRTELEKRMTQRYLCLKCGMIYSNVFVPKVPGVCNLCQGTQFEFRKDDRQDVIVRRLDIYEKDIGPLLNFYNEKGVLHVVDGTEPIDQVHSHIVKNVRAHSAYMPVKENFLEKKVLTATQQASRI